METCTLVYLDEAAAQELTPKELKELMTPETDVPLFLRVIGAKDACRSIKILLELLEHKEQVKVALYAAKSVSKYNKKKKRAKCIELVEKWLAGENVSKEELKDAAAAAADAAAAAAAAAADAAYTAADAAADAAAYAAYAAAAASRKEKYLEILEYGITLLSI